MTTFLYDIIIYPLYILIECIYTFCRKITDSSGISIIGVSIGVTLFCLPLYIVAEKWQEKERLLEKALQPGIDRIKKTFKNDERYMMTSTFYRENHYHPLMALRSSFGLLIQIPFFIAAFNFLSQLSSLSGSSFFFIRDLGSPDAFFSVKGFAINILPIAMTLINIIAGAIYTHGFKLKDKLQIYIMALVFLVLLYNSPSGLVLYWTMNNIFSLVKNIFYKLKNPAKTFYLFCCVLAAGMALYFLFVYRTKFANKAIAITFSASVIAIPLFISAIRYLLSHFMAEGLQNAKLRTVLAVLSCAVLFILAGLVIPTTLIASSPIEFSNIGGHGSPFFFVRCTGIQALGLFVFWPLCIYFLFGKKVQTVLAALLCIIAITAMANSFAFMLSYGDISQTLVFLNPAQFKPFSAISFANIAAICLIAVFCGRFFFAFHGKLFQTLLSISVIALLAISLANMAGIRKEYRNFLMYGASGTNGLEPLFHLSKDKKNVVLFMLDKAEGQFLPEILKEDPALKDIYSGFTYFPNVISFNGHTLIGSPGLYGGYEYIPEEMNRRAEERLIDKHNQALLLLPRVFTEQADFSATVSDPPWSNYSVFTDLRPFEDYGKISAVQTKECYNEAWFKLHPESKAYDNTEAILKRNLLFFSFFREAPICLREFIYHHGAYWSSDIEAKDFKTVMNSYAVLDLLPELTDFDAETGSYIAITNELPHEDYFLQAPDYRFAQTVNNRGTSKFKDDAFYHTNMASLKMLGTWIKYLKENGVYDNTRIIMVSDHGGSDKEDVFEADAELDARVAGSIYKGRGHYHCLLLYKDFGASGSLKTDDSFMTNADVPSLLLKGLIEKPMNPFTGKEIPTDTEPYKKDGVFITTSDMHQAGWNGKFTFSIKESEWWHVKENIFKAKNWTQESPFAKEHNDDEDK